MFTVPETLGAIGSLLVLLVVMPIGALAVWRLLDMLAAREIDLGEFWAIVSSALILIAVGLTERVSLDLAPLTVFVGLGLLLMPSALLFFSERCGRLRLRWDDAAKHLQAAEKHPDIPFHPRRLAELFRRGQEWALAAEFYERTLALRQDREVAFLLQRTRDRAAGQPTPLCSFCGKPVARGFPQCLFCGHRTGVRAVARTHPERRMVLVLGALGALAAGLVLGWAQWAPASLCGGLLILGFVLMAVHLDQVARER